MERGWTELGEVIRQHRQARGLSQEELAALCGSHFTYVSEIETSKVSPSVSVLRRIARALAVPTSQLVFEAEEREATKT